MKFYDAAELAARNLRESLLRNSLTTTGIAVGVASLVAMLSLGVGLQQLATRRLTRSGLFNSVIVYVQDRSHRHWNEEQPAANPPPLDAKARAAFQKMPGVVEVFPDIRFTGEIRYGDKSDSGMVAALPPSAAQSDDFEKLQGHFFAGPEAHEILLRTDFARELLTPEDAKPGAAPAEPPATLIGKEITLRYAARQAADPPQPAAVAQNWGFSVAPRELKLKVVGLVEREPNAGPRAFGRGTVFIPVALAEQLDPLQMSDLRSTPGRQPTYSSLTVRVGQMSQVQAVQDAIKAMGFGTFSLLDATRGMQRFFAVLDLFLGIFGSLALAVASLGIINTLVMAILERRREIGIMKAIGASEADVRKLFFTEAGVMGILGGLLGVALAWIIGHAINLGVNIYLERRQLPAEQVWALPWWLIFAALGFSVVVSLASGLYPARRAAQLDPVEALRYE